MKRSLWWGGLLVSAGMFLGSVVVPVVSGARAERFELVDKDAKVWAALTGPDSSGAREKTGLLLFDGKGEERASLELGENGQPELRLRDGRGVLRSCLSQSSLDLRDRAGWRLVELSLDPSVGPRLVMTGRVDEILFEAPEPRTYDQRVRACQANFKAITTATQAYFAMNKVWPDRVSDLVVGGTAPPGLRANLLSKTPVCPFGKPYSLVNVHEYPDDPQTPVVWKEVDWREHWHDAHWPGATKHLP